MSDASDQDSIPSLSTALNLAESPIRRLLAPVHEFARHRLAGAGLLMAAAIAGLVWANSAGHDSYHALLHLKLGVKIGDEIAISHSLHHWINDGLMGVFFFQVGLEIKRELLAGELSSMRKALLPAIAAVGGMLVPALLFLALNSGTPAQAGWGIPMATDIAFALGVLALLGDRIPLPLKVFLTALAIVDDIGAVAVIALFYTSDITLVALGIGGGAIGLSMLLNALGGRNPATYLFLGLIAWFAFLESGVHATIAALLMAFTIPARTRIDGRDFLGGLTGLIGRMEQLGPPTDRAMNSPQQQRLFEQMNKAIDYASAPLQRIEHALHGPVTFFILPVFAFANAGVTLEGSLMDALAQPVSIGIMVGLIAGKMVGVSAAAYVAVKSGLADLPKGVRWAQVVGCALLAGIGFTMSLFVASLAFEDPALLAASKLAILSSSMLAGLVGYAVLRVTSPSPTPPAPAP